MVQGTACIKMNVMVSASEVLISGSINIIVLKNNYYNLKYLYRLIFTYFNYLMIYYNNPVLQ